MTSNTRTLAVGALSGALSFASLFLASVLAAWAPGLIFGALVLAPSHSGRSRRAALVVASAGIYRAAVWLATTLYTDVSQLVPGCALAGALGALALALATGWITGESLDRRATRLAVILGAAAGALFDVYLRFGDDQRLVDFGLVLGCYVLWQASFAALHGLAPWHAFARAEPANPAM